MTEVPARAERTNPPGALPLVALGLAALLVAAGGVVGVAMGMTGTRHAITWGGSGVMAGGAGSGEAVAAAAPAFSLEGLPSDTVSQYRFARDNAEVYARIPCFCGCAEMLGHRNLAQCFVTPEGTWESHGAGCEVCLAESRTVMRMMGQGMSLPTMRDRIVARFGGPMAGSPMMGAMVEEG